MTPQLAIVIGVLVLGLLLEIDTGLVAVLGIIGLAIALVVGVDVRVRRV